MLICTTPPDSTAGPAIKANRFRSAVQWGKPKVKVYPAFRAACQVKANCATPVTGTVHDKVCPISQPNHRARNIAAMKTRFMRTGTNDASVKWPRVVRIPDSSATSEMNKM